MRATEYGNRIPIPSLSAIRPPRSTPPRSIRPATRACDTRNAGTGWPRRSGGSVRPAASQSRRLRVARAMLARWAKVVERWPSSMSAAGRRRALTQSRKSRAACRSRSPSVALTTSSLRRGFGILERAAALGDDLVAVDVRIRRPDRAAQLDLGAAGEDGLAVGLVDAEEAQHARGVFEDGPRRYRGWCGRRPRRTARRAPRRSPGPARRSASGSGRSSGRPSWPPATSRGPTSGTCTA